MKKGLTELVFILDKSGSMGGLESYTIGGFNAVLSKQKAEAAVSAPQSTVANIMAATAVVSYLYNILVLGAIGVRSVTFSTKTVNLKPSISKPSKRKAA